MPFLGAINASCVIRYASVLTPVVCSILTDAQRAKGSRQCGVGTWVLTGARERRTPEGVTFIKGYPVILDSKREVVQAVKSMNQSVSHIILCESK